MIYQITIYIKFVISSLDILINTDYEKNDILNYIYITIFDNFKKSYFIIVLIIKILNNQNTPLV